MLNRKIIVVPCMVNSSLKLDGPSTFCSGAASWVRMANAWRPARKKNTNAVTM